MQRIFYQRTKWMGDDKLRRLDMMANKSGCLHLHDMDDCQEHVTHNDWTGGNDEADTITLRKKMMWQVEIAKRRKVIGRRDGCESLGSVG